jgi:hypothetical protein
MRPILTQSHKNIILESHKDKTCKEFADQFGCSMNVLQVFAHKNGIQFKKARTISEKTKLIYSKKNQTIINHSLPRLYIDDLYRWA